ncbi:MAG: NADH-quinone oxidoreductase subunit C [Pseudomonadota bacterium]|jgi:NADH-quinone oxidoreductase subunit C
MEEAKVGSIEQVKEAIAAACGPAVISSVVERGDLIVTVRCDSVAEVLRTCKEAPELAFEVLADLTAVDWLDARSERFEVVYQLLSVSKKQRITLKVAVPEDRPEIASATAFWNSANFLEREVWDMFGIRFVGHSDLRRILMYDEFVGHPLRKDYPVQGKQPRVPLRYPEVENTARKMQRPDLVTIRSKKSIDGDGGRKTSDQQGAQ